MDPRFAGHTLRETEESRCTLNGRCPALTPECCTLKTLGFDQEPESRFRRLWEKGLATSFHSNIFPLLKLRILLGARVRLVAWYREHWTWVRVTVRHCLTRKSHSLRLLASVAESRIPKGYSLGAPSAPPRSPTLSPIGRQQRPRLSLLEVTEGASCQDPTFPSISRRGDFSVRFGFAETRDGILAFGFLPSLGPSAHPFWLDAHDLWETRASSQGDARRGRSQP